MTPTTLAEAREAISGNNSFESLMCEALHKAGDSPLRYMKNMKSGAALQLAKDDPLRPELENHPDPRVRALMAARTAVKSVPLHIARIDGLMAQAKALGGKLPVPLRYYGGHTGRWSGAEGLNLQNLPRSGRLAAIRGLIIPRPGHRLIICDAAQIEARVTAWFADEQDLLAAFAKGADVYSQFASRFFGISVRKPKKTDIPVIAKMMGDRRNFGKVCILGMGFGMGKDRFREYAEAQTGQEVSPATAEAAVKLYRASYPKTVQMWYKIEQAFTYTARYGHPCECHNLRFDKLPDCDVAVTLPSGSGDVLSQAEDKPGWWAGSV